MKIKIYNTLSRKKEEFIPVNEGRVSMYQCGPTVYDTPHLGNYRTFIMNDLIRRTFEYNSYEVNQVMNITDVDDKTIRRSHEENISLQDLTKKYEAMFLQGLKLLNILHPNKLVRATESIQPMIDLIQKLLDLGIAYAAEDGVYMSIAKVKNYGALAGLSLETTKSERISNDEYDKENPHDFALWKFKTDADHNIAWPAPFGEGRPGWHIECSAMAIQNIGPTIDIHTGGSDLIFPHHTNEIAQSESATGKKFANYWAHGGFMTIKTEKMSKSVGNIIKLENLENESLSPLAFRYWLLTAHYRTLIDFSTETLHAAQTALIRFVSLVSAYEDGGNINEAYKEKFTTFINDDFDMPKALALAWELIKDSSVSAADKRATILDFDKVFGLDIKSVRNVTNDKIPEEIFALGELREAARKSKDWQKADAIRLEIEGRGYKIKDNDSGFIIETGK